MRTKDTKRGNLRSRVRECVRERGREEHVFVAATAAWESRNVMRLTDIKLKYPFWEFAASRVADLPVMFSPALSSFFFSLPFLPPCLPPVPSLSGPGCYRGRGKNRIFHRDVVERARPSRVVANLICLSLVISSDTRARDI